jgi:hypothetical protein
VDQVKWITIGLAAAVLALAAGAIALATRGERAAREVVTTTQSSPIGAALPGVTMQLTRPVSARKKPARRGVQPSVVRPCQSNGDESDPTGDDRPSARSAKGVCHTAGKNTSAADNETDDSRSDEGGDNQAGDDKNSGA